MNSKARFQHKNKAAYQQAILTVLLLLSGFGVSNAQNKIHISLKNSSFAAKDTVLPFWFISNQNGRIQPEGTFLNVSEFVIGQQYRQDSAQTKLTYTWGSHVVAGLGETNYLQLNRAFAGLSWKGWEIKGGLFYDDIYYAGLSTTNGNLARSQHARPVPKIRIATVGYKKLPFFKKWFRFKAEYDEGFLNDERYVDGAHLHHKSLYGEFRVAKDLNFYMGLEHYVMWGGTSQKDKIGQLPEDWCSYWRYVLALPGSDKFLETDKKNISGNQLGTYQFEIKKDFKSLSTSIYLSHPWEDNSGLIWRNWRDNLIGIHFHFNKEKKLISDIVYEFTNTRNQSLKDSLYNWDSANGRWRTNEVDNYFNHGIYKSGFTYRQMGLNSPLFFPVTISNGISMGFRSTRFVSHHLGLKGNISRFLYWKGLLTFVQHLGNYTQPYDPDENQFSGLLDLKYKNPDFPVDLSLSVAADLNNIVGNNLGFQLTISKSW